MPRIRYFASDNVLENFYKALSTGNGQVLERVHIPLSDVFYVREAIFNKSGVKYTLDRIERAMFLEKMLDRKDVFDPDRVRDWEKSDGVSGNGEKDEEETGKQTGI